MKFDKLKPGMVVYDIGRRKMGNTTISTIAAWTIEVISVDAEARTCVAEWNHNPARTYREADVSAWKENKPFLIRESFGNYRKPTRSELAEIKAKQRESAQERKP